MITLHIAAHESDARVGVVLHHDVLLRHRRHRAPPVEQLHLAAPGHACTGSTVRIRRAARSDATPRRHATPRPVVCHLLMYFTPTQPPPTSTQFTNLQKTQPSNPVWHLLHACFANQRLLLLRLRELHTLPPPASPAPASRAEPRHPVKRETISKTFFPVSQKKFNAMFLTTTLKHNFFQLTY